jgi:hypothetical protein
MRHVARPTLCLLAALLFAFPATRAAAGGETIVRQYLDAGRVQFTGMDINGDGVADSIRLDRLEQTLVYFVGDARKNLRSFDPSSLPEEDRRFVPDVLIERDLDGDEIADLLLFNRGYLTKYADDRAALQRILTGCIHIGQSGGRYLELDAVRPSEEARAAILERARTLALPGR